MADIKIFELAGSELFHDSESFLNELTEAETVSVEGGLDLVKALAVISVQTPDLDKLKSYQTVVSIKGNSINNNTINGQTINGQGVNG